MKKIAVFTFLTFTLFFGCKSATQAPQSNDVIMPLAPGNAWYYSVDVFSSNGTKVNTTLDSLVISSQHQVNGETRYTLWTGTDIMMKSTALVSYPYNSPSIDSPYIWVRYPMPMTSSEITAKYILTKEFSPDPIELLDVILTLHSPSIPVVVPSGSYTALEYQFEFKGETSGTIYSRRFDYYALNVGRVMSEEFQLDSASGKYFLATREQLTKVVLN